MHNFLAGYISPRTDVHQMRENLSLLSFWGLVFSLIAVTLFVVIYWYQKSKYANREIVKDLRQRSVDVYLAAKTPEAESDSKRFREASNEIERLRAETRVLFWLIIAMNTAVIIIFILAYRYSRHQLIRISRTSRREPLGQPAHGKLPGTRYDGPRTAANRTALYRAAHSRVTGELDA